MMSSSQHSSARASSSSSGSHHRRHHRSSNGGGGGGSSKKKRRHKDRKNAYIPTLKEAQTGRSNALKKKKAHFLCRVTLQATPPPLPCTSRTLAMPLAEDQWYRYSSAALSAQVPLQVHYDGNLGIPIDLMEMSTSTRAELSVEDQRLLTGFAERTVLANQKANGLGSSTRKSKSKSVATIGVSRPKGTKASEPVTWLRKTRMLANDMTQRSTPQKGVMTESATGGAGMSAVVAETSAVSIEEQVERVENSFNVTMRRPVNPDDASVRAVDVSSLQPDEDVARLHCMHVMFDTSPSEVLMNRRARSGGAKCARATNIDESTELVEASVLSRHSQKAFGMYVPGNERDAVPPLPATLQVTKHEAGVLQPPNFTWPNRSSSNDDDDDDDDDGGGGGGGGGDGGDDNDDADNDNKKHKRAVPTAGARVPDARVPFEWAREYILKPETMTDRPLAYFCLAEGSARYGQYTGRWRMRKRGGADRVTEQPESTRPEMLVFNEFQ